MSTGWQDTLYNGMSAETGRTPHVNSTMITKSTMRNQLSEIQRTQPTIVSTHDSMRGVTKKYKHKFSAHRAMSFLPQE